MQQIFNEKYRPNKFNEVIGLDSEIPKLVKDGNIPHLLFIGPAGTGKTTTARIIIKELDADSLVLNASKERGIDTIRNKIEPFASKASDKIKIVFLDEFDHTTPAFQTALRNFMETHSLTTRFIATCNYPTKIIDPLKSRFAQFNFSRYDEEHKWRWLKGIVDTEKINIEDSTLFLLVRKYKDDIRAMINFLNKNKKKEIKKEDITREDVVLNILAKLKDKKWHELRTSLLLENLDYASLIEECEIIIFNHKAIPLEAKRKANILASKYQFEMYFSFNKELAFSSFLAELESVLQW